MIKGLAFESFFKLNMSHSYSPDLFFFEEVRFSEAEKINIHLTCCSNFCACVQSARGMQTEERR